MEFILSKKKLEKIFFGPAKIFFMPGGGPRPACHIPDPRDSWSLQVGTVVWSCYCKPGCEPVSSVVLENWVLLIAI